MSEFCQKGFSKRGSFSISCHRYTIHISTFFNNILITTFIECDKYLYFFLITGLLALTVGSGKKAQEILEEAVSPISEALKSRSESSKIASVNFHITFYLF